MTFHIVEVNRPLDPCDVEVRQPARGLDRLRKAPASIGIRHDADVRAGGVANRLHTPKILLGIRTSNLKFHGAITLLLHEALAVGDHHIEGPVEPSAVGVVGLDFF